MTLEEAKEEIHNSIITINDILKDPTNTVRQKEYLTGKMRGYEYGQYLLNQIEEL
jgi:hypothetical protein